FLFDTESGAIEGWNYSISTDSAIIAVNNGAKGAVYKGLALDNAGKLLFAGDFARNRVQVFDNQFNPIRSFTDKTLPAGFAPFNVVWINNELYVAFAKREKGGIDE